MVKLSTIKRPSFALIFHFVETHLVHKYWSYKTSCFMLLIVLRAGLTLNNRKKIHDTCQYYTAINILIENFISWVSRCMDKNA